MVIFSLHIIDLRYRYHSEFVNGLEASFPSTVSTIIRTAGKLGMRTADVQQTGAKSTACPLCGLYAVFLVYLADQESNANDELFEKKLDQLKLEQRSGDERTRYHRLLCLLPTLPPQQTLLHLRFPSHLYYATDAC